ncbi:hypothetical protein [Fructobacillus fructosus]|uniref:hypothetical protein n=1 Tax=Fructobacillus fructosus TaxID=1631 RepID=UPI001658A35C|nr:hypothetical protein [Fructobacillus fructosus]MBC9119448.1 hypothetical protein [Fructobacillus fructosus]MBD9367049.1 hypothetical protein [Leuconostoc mesenteroides]
MNTNNMGLDSFRKKKTERPKNISPEISEEIERSMPEDLLKLPETRLTSKDLPKSIRLPLNTHTAVTTIATLQSKKIYEVINDIVEDYISELPIAEKKIIKSSIETVQHSQNNR